MYLYIIPLCVPWAWCNDIELDATIYSSNSYVSLPRFLLLLLSLIFLPHRENFVGMKRISRFLWNVFGMVETPKIQIYKKFLDMCCVLEPEIEALMRWEWLKLSQVEICEVGKGAKMFSKMLSVVKWLRGFLIIVLWRMHTEGLLSTHDSHLIWRRSMNHFYFTRSNHFLLYEKWVIFEKKLPSRGS